MSPSSSRSLGDRPMAQPVISAFCVGPESDATDLPLVVSAACPQTYLARHGRSRVSGVLLSS